MRPRPDRRWLATKNSAVEPEQKIERECWRHIKKIEESSSIARALEIYEEPFERERLQPWIIANATDIDINTRVGLSIPTLQAYRQLFFDLSVFRDELDKQFWVANYVNNGGSLEGAAFLQKAVLFGVESVAHVMGAYAKLDPQYVVEQAMRDLFFRGQAIRNGKLTSPETAAAHSLLKTAVEHSQLLTKTRPANVTDIMLKLKNRDMTHSLEDVVLEDEILH